MDGMKYHDKIFELNSFVKELLEKLDKLGILE